MREILNEMHNWMTNYMKSFYTEDEEVQRGILLKEKHTGYVTTNSIELAKHLKLNEHDVELAEIIGLFHESDVSDSTAFIKLSTMQILKIMQI